MRVHFTMSWQFVLFYRVVYCRVDFSILFSMFWKSKHKKEIKFIYWKKNVQMSAYTALYRTFWYVKNQTWHQWHKVSYQLSSKTAAEQENIYAIIQSNTVCIIKLGFYHLLMFFCLKVKLFHSVFSPPKSGRTMNCLLHSQVCQSVCISMRASLCIKVIVTYLVASLCSPVSAVRTESCFPGGDTLNDF